MSKNKLAFNPLAINHTLVNQEAYINKDVKKYCEIRNGKSNLFRYENVTVNNLTFKIINWYTIVIMRNYKLTIIVARNVNTRERIYFSFEYLTPIFMLKSELSEIKNFLKLENEKLIIIEKKCLGKFKISELYNFFKLYDVRSIFQKIENKPIIESDVYLIESNIKITEDVTILYNEFGGCHMLKPFFIMNNVLVDGVYNLQEMTLKQNKVNNMYFIEKHQFKEFFGDPVNKIINSIENIVSFDIENIISKKNGKIFSKANVMPMIAYSIMFNEIEYSFCFINIDYIISDAIRKFKPNLFKTTDIEIIYELVLKRENSYEYLEYFDLDNIVYDDQYLNKNIEVLNHVLFDDLHDYLMHLVKDKIKYICSSEYDFLIFFRQLLESDLFDIVCHYNGNGYDYKMMEIRKIRIEEILRIKPEGLTFKKFFGKEVHLKHEISSKSNFKATRLLLDLPIKNFDLMTLAKIQLERKLENIGLNDVSMYYFNEKGISNQSDEYYYQYIIVLDVISNSVKHTSFEYLLRLANYCNIDDTIYKIIKSDLIMNQFNITIETLDRKKDTYLNLVKTKVKFSIIKDDINITNNEVYNLENIISTAKYCLTDSALPLCLISIMNYLHLSSVEGRICYMTQAQALQYQNATKLKGALLKIFMNEKVFLTKNKMIAQSNDKKGGLVFTPKKKFNTKTLVVLDFNSLYPSIIGNYNISIDTYNRSFFLKDKFAFKLAKTYFDNNLTDKYRVVEIEDSFVLHIFDLDKRGILGYVVDDFIKERKIAKQNMANATNEIDRTYFSILENYLKVLSNSVYGLTGVSFDSIYLSTEIAESICAIGRLYNHNTFDMIDGLEIINNKFVIKKKIFNLYKNELLTTIDSNILKTHKLTQDYKLVSTYGDTDSIMIELIAEKKNIKDEIIIGHAIAETINELTNKMLEIKLESIMLCCFLKKKNYAAYALDDIAISKIKDKTNDEIFNLKKLIIKGISSTKRGVCMCHRKIVIEFIKYLLTLLYEETVNVNSFDFTNVLINKIKNLVSECYSNWLLREKANDINIKDFLIYIKYKKSKIETNTTNILVNEYNNTDGISDFITEDNKFPYFHFVLKKDLKQKIDFKTIKINETKKIYDHKYTNFNETTINYTIYLYKIIKSLFGLIDTTEKSIEKNAIEMTNNVVELLIKDY